MRIRIIRRRNGIVTKDFYYESRVSLSPLDAPTYVLVANDVKQLDLSFQYYGGNESEVKRALSIGTLVYGRTTGRVIRLSLNGSGHILPLPERMLIIQGMSTNMVSRFDAGIQIASEIEQAFKRK